MQQIIRNTRAPKAVPRSADDMFAFYSIVWCNRIVDDATVVSAVAVPSTYRSPRVPLVAASTLKHAHRTANGVTQLHAIRGHPLSSPVAQPIRRRHAPSACSVGMLHRAAAQSHRWSMKLSHTKILDLDKVSTHTQYVTQTKISESRLFFLTPKRRFVPVCTHVI